MSNMGNREVSISKMLMCKNMAGETSKNKNYLVAYSELGLAIYAYDNNLKKNSCCVDLNDKIELQGMRKPQTFERQGKTECCFLCIKVGGVQGERTTLREGS